MTTRAMRFGVALLSVCLAPGCAKVAEKPAPGATRPPTEEGLEASPDWTTEAWGSAAEISVAAPEGGTDKVLRVFLADAESGRAHAVLARDLDLSECAELTFDVCNFATVPIAVSVGFTSVPGFRFFESVPETIPPTGERPRRVRIDLTAQRFKCADSKWRHTSALLHRDAIKKIYLMVYTRAAGEWVCFNSVRLGPAAAGAAPRIPCPAGRPPTREEPQQAKPHRVARFLRGLTQGIAEALGFRAFDPRVDEGLEASPEWTSQAWGSRAEINVSTPEGSKDKVLHVFLAGAERDKVNVGLSVRNDLDLSECKQLRFDVRNLGPRPVRVAAAFISNPGFQYFESPAQRIRPTGRRPRRVRIDLASARFKCKETQWRFESKLLHPNAIRWIYLVIYTDMTGEWVYFNNIRFEPDMALPQALFADRPFPEPPRKFANLDAPVVPGRGAVLGSARTVADLYKASKTMPYLGFNGSTVTDELARELGLEVTRGVLVTAVLQGSPAEKAGLTKGDIIQSSDGLPIRAKAGLTRALDAKEPGDTVTLGGMRGKDELAVTVKLGSRPRSTTVSGHVVAARASEGLIRWRIRQGIDDTEQTVDMPADLMVFYTFYTKEQRRRQVLWLACDWYPSWSSTASGRFARGTFASAEVEGGEIRLLINVKGSEEGPVEFAMSSQVRVEYLTLRSGPLIATCVVPARTR